jgi:cytochrome c-type biogenesis protein CcmH/NrfG
MAFLLGQNAFNQGELESALSYFALVSPDSSFWARSLYYKGITYVRQYDAQPAVDAFKALLALDGKGAEADEAKAAPAGRERLQSMDRRSASPACRRVIRR